MAAARQWRKHVLLTGRPGVGKTTVVERVVAGLPPGSARGFLTREVREGGVRVGFAIETLDGARGVLARVDLPVGPRIGRYRVALDQVERLLPEAIRPVPRVRFVVIDEIGRMECLSPRFRAAVRVVLDAPVRVLGTVPQHADEFISELLERPDVTVVEVRAHNRDALPGEILAALLGAEADSGPAGRASTPENGTPGT